MYEKKIATDLAPVILPSKKKVPTKLTIQNIRQCVAALVDKGLITKKHT